MSKLKNSFGQFSINTTLTEISICISQLGMTGGWERQLGQNDQKLHENNKISVFWAK